MKLLLPLLLVFCTLFFLSCKKALPPSVDDKIFILEHLNQGRPDLALALIARGLQENPDDQELHFLKASAFSLKGGMDVYKLFPLLEMKLFHSPVRDWDQLKKFNNPYVRFLKNQGPLEKDKELVLLTMNYLWGLYEIIPILRKIPLVKITHLPYLKKALEILVGLNRGIPLSTLEKSLGKKIKGHMAFLSAILFFNEFRNRVKIEEEKGKEGRENPIDFFCHFSLRKFLANPEDMQNYLHYFSLAVSGSQLDNKYLRYLDENFSQIHLGNFQETQYLICVPLGYSLENEI